LKRGEKRVLPLFFITLFTIRHRIEADGFVVEEPSPGVAGTNK
jgi:hypothetical protein